MTAQRHFTAPAKVTLSLRVTGVRPDGYHLLDALVAWSLARPTQLTFRTEPSASGALSFDLAGTNTVFWSARPRLSTSPV